MHNLLVALWNSSHRCRAKIVTAEALFAGIVITSKELPFDPTEDAWGIEVAVEKS